MEVQPTTSCASIVAGWLKASSRPAPLPAAETMLPDEAFAPRAERLGLGAKYISHSQAATLGIDERRFSNKLAKVKQQAAASSSSMTSAPAKSTKKRQQAAATQDDDDSEDEGRSAVSRKGAKKKKKK